MSIDPANSDPSDPNQGSEIDCTTYTEILRGLSTSLRSSDFSTQTGGLSFIMETVDQTFCNHSNQRSLERTSEMVSALAYLVLILLGHHEDPNDLAAQVADALEEGADEMVPIPPIRNIDQLEFEVAIDGFQDVIMSFDELVERMELPLEDFVALTQDLALLETVEDVESLFRQIDGE